MRKWNADNADASQRRFKRIFLIIIFNNNR